MKRWPQLTQQFISASSAIVLSLALTGCSTFFPDEVPIPTSTMTEVPKPATTPAATLDPNLNQVDINILSTTASRDTGYIQVIAEALDVMEEDGKCILKVTQGDISQSVSVKAEPNVTSTQCFPMEVPINGFTVGAISYSVTYISGESSGIADSLKMEIE